ncbi:hypothetical protein Bca101_025738 [Brassica carinata]
MQDIVFICTGRVTHVYIGKRVLLRCLLQMQQKTAAHCLRLFFLPSPPLHVCDATILLLEPSGIYRVEMTIADDTAGANYITSEQLKLAKCWVSTYNFTANHQTFTVSRIIDERDRVPLPGFVENGGNDDGGDDMRGGNPVPAKVETRGSSGGADSSSKVVKKARMA